MQPFFKIIKELNNLINKLIADKVNSSNSNNKILSDRVNRDLLGVVVGEVEQGLVKPLEKLILKERRLGLLGKQQVDEEEANNEL